jgi:hypothetical protein
MPMFSSLSHTLSYLWGNVHKVDLQYWVQLLGLMGTHRSILADGANGYTQIYACSGTVRYIVATLCFTCVHPQVLCNKNRILVKTGHVCL